MSDIYQASNDNKQQVNYKDKHANYTDKKANAKQKNIVEKNDVLMHCCCGPCAEWPLYALREEGFEVTAYFFNPNIHPKAELDKRSESMVKMAEIHNLPLVIDDSYMEQAWRRMDQEKKSTHCSFCYKMRLERTARYARDHGFSAITTSLLVSPYQDREKIHEIAEKLCQEYGLKYINRAFHEHFREGQKMAKDDGLYCQKYCACIFSLNETAEKFRDKLLKEFGMELSDLPVRS